MLPEDLGCPHCEKDCDVCTDLARLLAEADAKHAALVEEIAAALDGADPYREVFGGLSAARFVRARFGPTSFAMPQRAGEV